MKRLTVVALSMFIAACGGENSTTGPAGPTSVSLTGVVAAFDGRKITAATVTILDGPNAGKATTSTTGGVYVMDGLTSGNANVSAARSDLGFTTAVIGVNVNGTNTLDFMLQAPLFSRSGSGNDVFTMPVYVSKVRITGDFGGNCQNFILHINSRSVVNEILGTCSVASGPHFEGTLLVPNPVLTLPGQLVETLSSNSISWVVTESR